MHHLMVDVTTSLVAQTAKRLPVMQEARVRFLGREDPLEKEMAMHSTGRCRLVLEHKNTAEPINRAGSSNISGTVLSA